MVKDTILVIQGNNSISVGSEVFVTNGEGNIS